MNTYRKTNASAQRAGILHCMEMVERYMQARLLMSVHVDSSEGLPVIKGNLGTQLGYWIPTVCV